MGSQIQLRRMRPERTWFVGAPNLIAAAAESYDDAANAARSMGLDTYKIFTLPAELEGYAFVFGVVTVSAVGVVVRGITDDPKKATESVAKFGGEIRIVRLNPKFDHKEVVLIDEGEYSVL